MPKIKKVSDIKKEEDIKEVEENVEEIEEIEENGGNPNTILLKGVIELVKAKFNLGEDYTLLSFKDGGRKVSISLATEDYNVNLVVSGKTLFDLKYSLGLCEE